MTKTQGWIVVGILVIALALGVWAWFQYQSNQHAKNGEEIAACLNQCNVQAGENTADNACFVSCIEADGLSLNGITNSNPQ